MAAVYGKNEVVNSKAVCDGSMDSHLLSSTMAAVDSTNAFGEEAADDIVLRDPHMGGDNLLFSTVENEDLDHHRSKRQGLDTWQGEGDKIPASMEHLTWLMILRHDSILVFLQIRSLNQHPQIFSLGNLSL